MIKKRKAEINIRALVFILLTVIWCGVIFTFSAQKADESSETSGGVIYMICRMTVSGFTDLSDAAREELIESMQFWVRKAAHFTVYLILGVLSVQIFLAVGRPVLARNCALSALGFCLLYAVSDELHQHFVPGRSCQLRDVCIDTAGAAVGILLSAAVFALRSKNDRKLHT